jgi:flagellin
MGTPITIPNASVVANVTNYSNAAVNAATSYTAFSTELSTLISTAASTSNSTVASASTVFSSTDAAAQATRDTAISAASTVLSTAISTALSTLGEDIGDVVPYKLGVDASNVVGKAASGDTVYTANRENGITITAGSAGTKYQISGLTFSVQDSQGKVKKSVNAVLDNFNESVRAVNKSNDNAINLQVGTRANQTIRIGLTDMRSEALGLKSSDGTTISVSTQKNANAAVNVLDNAIQKALDQQTDIGAVEARLEMTSQNLTTSSQNVQASESVIRDADMAKEMTEFTKNNILLQAAQAMLAQANQSSSSVLSLLQ